MAFLLPAAATTAGTATAATSALSASSLFSYASMASTLLGAVRGSQGDTYSAKAAAESARYNAAIASNNAITANRNAVLAAQEGAAELNRQQMETRARVGAIKAEQGASGVDINSPSSVDVRSSAAATGQLNALSVRSAATRKAYGYQQQEKDYQAEAGLQNASAKNAKTAGKITSSTTLLGGIGTAADNYGKYLRERNPISLGA